MPAHRVAQQYVAFDIQGVDQLVKIVDIVPGAIGWWLRMLAFAVPPPVWSDHPKGLGKGRRDKVPPAGTGRPTMTENKRSLACGPPIEVVQTEIVDRDKVRLGLGHGC